MSTSCGLLCKNWQFSNLATPSNTTKKAPSVSLQPSVGRGVGLLVGGGLGFAVRAGPVGFIVGVGVTGAKVGAKVGTGLIGILVGAGATVTGSGHLSQVRRHAS